MFGYWKLPAALTVIGVVAAACGTGTGSSTDAVDAREAAGVVGAYNEFPNWDGNSAKTIDWGYGAGQHPSIECFWGDRNTNYKLAPESATTGFESLANYQGDKKIIDLMRGSGVLWPYGAAMSTSTRTLRLAANTGGVRASDNQSMEATNGVDPALDLQGDQFRAGPIGHSTAPLSRSSNEGQSLGPMCAAWDEQQVSWENGKFQARKAQNFKVIGNRYSSTWWVESDYNTEFINSQANVKALAGRKVKLSGKSEESGTALTFLTNRCAGAANSVGAAISISACGGSDVRNQKWEYLPAGNDWFLYRKLGTNLCMNATSDGKVGLQECLNNSYQWWKLGNGGNGLSGGVIQPYAWSGGVTNAIAGSGIGCLNVGGRKNELVRGSDCSGAYWWNQPSWSSKAKCDPGQAKDTAIACLVTKIASGDRNNQVGLVGAYLWDLPVRLTVNNNSSKMFVLSTAAASGVEPGIVESRALAAADDGGYVKIKGGRKSGSIGFLRAFDLDTPELSLDYVRGNPTQTADVSQLAVVKDKWFSATFKVKAIDVNSLANEYDSENYEEEAVQEMAIKDCVAGRPTLKKDTTAEQDAYIEAFNRYCGEFTLRVWANNANETQKDSSSGSTSIDPGRYNGVSFETYPSDSSKWKGEGTGGNEGLCVFDGSVLNPGATALSLGNDGFIDLSVRVENRGNSQTPCKTGGVLSNGT